MTLNPHPLLVPWSRKGRAIPLLPLWAVRPVQNISACTRVHFTFTFLLFVYYAVTTRHYEHDNYKGRMNKKQITSLRLEDITRQAMYIYIYVIFVPVKKI